MKKLIPFDLNKVKTGAKIVTEDGCKATFIADNIYYSSSRPLCLFEVQTSVGNRKYLYAEDGKYFFHNNDHLQLFIETELSLRPWKPEEVPVGCMIRHKNDKNILHSILCSQPAGILLAYAKANKEYVPAYRYNYHIFQEEFNIITKYYEHSLDHGKTWQPCGVLEEQ